jgi:ParB family chromosome partitioning protein
VDIVTDVAIDRIKVGRRVRNDLGDLRHLMNSLRRYGQLSPIILNENYELIAGNRRLEAARALGWISIKAAVLNRNTDLEKLELELEENIQRRDLSPEELSDGFDRLDKLRNPTLIKRIFRCIRSIWRRGR